MTWKDEIGDFNWNNQREINYDLTSTTVAENPPCSPPPSFKCSSATVNSAIHFPSPPPTIETWNVDIKRKVIKTVTLFQRNKFENQMSKQKTFRAFHFVVRRIEISIDLSESEV